MHFEFQALNLPRKRHTARLQCGTSRRSTRSEGFIIVCLAFTWANESPGWRVWDWIGALIWLGIGAMVAYDAVEPLWQWKLHHEAYRRIRLERKTTSRR